MSITGISTSSVTQLGQSGSSYFSQVKEAWQNLQGSLNSGDMAGAKAAVATIQKLQEKYESLFSSQDESAIGQFTSDLQALSAALNSGDLNAAQSAFGSLKTDLNSQREQFAKDMTNAVASAHSEALRELFGAATDSSSDSGNSLLDVLASNKGKNLDVVG